MATLQDLYPDAFPEGLGFVPPGVAGPQPEAIPEAMPMPEQSGFQFNPSEVEQLAALLGGGASQPPPTPYGFGDRFAMALSQMQMPQVRGFGGNLVRGAAQGFAGARTNEIARKEKAAQEKFQREQQARSEAAKLLVQRKIQMDAERRDAARDANLEALKATLTARRDAAKDERERKMWEMRLKSAEKQAALSAKSGGSSTGRIPTSGQVDKLSVNASMLDNLGAIEAMYKPEYAGVKNRLGGGFIKDTLGKGLAPGEADFRAAVANYRNYLINYISGAAVSAQEAVRLRQQIPDANDPPEVFEAKLRQSRAIVRRASKKYRDTLRQTGYDISGLDPMPEPRPGDDDYGASMMNSKGKPAQRALIRMRAPDGTEKDVPEDQVDHYLDLGAEVIE